VWPVHDARAEIVVLDRAARRLQAAPFWPRIARSHAEAQDRVRSRLIEHAPTRVGHVVHRDLYAEQVRLVDGGVGFLDLDEASLGEPAIDLGNLVAHLEMADLQRDGSPGAGGALGGALVDAYRIRGAIDPGRLAVYRAATLLRLASLARVAERSRSVLPWQELAARLIGMAAS
jgi:aminoglycoside phosphotransferase (APT) family kinase protein